MTKFRFKWDRKTMGTAVSYTTGFIHKEFGLIAAHYKAFILVDTDSGTCKPYLVLPNGDTHWKSGKWVSLTTAKRWAVCELRKLMR